MKRKILALVIASAMMFTSGCGGKGPEKTENDTKPSETIVVEKEPVDYNKVYAPVLDAYYNLIYYGVVEEVIEDNMGVMDILTWEGYDEAAEQFGYAIEDVSGDGVPELLMSFIYEQTYEDFFGRDVFAMYSCANGEPEMVFDGGGRQSYYMMENGNMLYMGSAGAAYSIFGIYIIEEDGTKLVCDEYYFTHEVDEDFSDIGCYYNNTGEWDTEVSEKLDITLEELWDIEIELMEQVALVKVEPFIEYVPVNVDVYEAPAYTEEAWVNVCYADDVVTEATNYEWFTADDSPDCEKVLFMAEGDVRDFKFLSLLCEDVLEDGTPVFTVEEMLYKEKLDPEMHLLVEMTFWGTIPSYGYSFVDDEGNTRMFTIEMSGMDGSIYTNELQG